MTSNPFRNIDYMINVYLTAVKRLHRYYSYLLPLSSLTKRLLKYGMILTSLTGGYQHGRD